MPQCSSEFPSETQQFYQDIAEEGFTSEIKLCSNRYFMITFTKFVILSMIDAERIGELGDDPIPLS